MGAAPALAIRSLSVRLSRDGVESRVLDGISLDIAAGEVVALVGESGSGKSSLAQAILGLLPEAGSPRLTGSIVLAGTEVLGAKPAQLRELRRRFVRAVPQDPLAGLDPTMRVGRQLEEAAGGPTDMRLWLVRMGLADPDRIVRAWPHELSGGQRQRVLIAMAMAVRPRLLLADEPTTALDVTTQAQLIDLLARTVRDERTAMLFITHDLAIAASLADRIVVLNKGRVVEQGRPEEVIGRPRETYTARLVGARFDLATDRSRPLPVGGASTSHWPAVPATDRPVLELSGVSKSFATHGRFRSAVHQVLRSIDLAIGAGECLALVGESGSGKSTILRIAAGLMSPDSGTVRRSDQVPQLVFQDPASALTPWLGIGDQIAEPLRQTHRDPAARRSRVDEVMRLVGLDPKLSSALPGELSIGQCQRALLARAIAPAPQILLCDEPVSAMDVTLAANVLNLLGQLRRQLGMAVLFVTHDIAAARLVADRIAVLRDGVILEEGPAEAVTASPKNAYTQQLMDAVPRITVST